jgi:RNA polymerase sigma-70 factor, ECF subfamily
MDATRQENEILLLQQVQCGDFSAFDALQESLEPLVRRFVRRLIGWHDSEDDIVQLVFLALFRHAGRINPPEKLRPYMYRIVRNRCYDELRKQGRYEPASLEDDMIELQVSFASSEQQVQPEDAAHWLLLHLEVQEAMQKLPELQRQALILYAEEEMSYSEIALAMHTTTGTVKSRIHHAKKTLRRLLNPATLQALDITFTQMNDQESE